MLDYFAFRNKATATFPNLVVSVMMYERGSGLGGEVTMYRVKVAGMAIGEDVKSEGADAETVLREAVRRVSVARKAVKQAQWDKMVARHNRGLISGASGGLALAA